MELGESAEVGVSTQSHFTIEWTITMYDVWLLPIESFEYLWYSADYLIVLCEHCYSARDRKACF